MKLLTGLAATAVAGLAAAASHEPAQVYLFQKQADNPQAPSPLPRQIARQVLLQRLGADHDSLLADLPNGLDQETAISYIMQYGRTPTGLFVEKINTGRPGGEPQQMALVIEGATSTSLKALVDALPEARKQPAFTIRDPPASKANQHLLDTDLAQSGVRQGECELADALDLSGPSCWSSGIYVRGYDLKKSPAGMDDLISSLPTLLKYVDSGDMEALLFLMPESSRLSPIAHWTTNPPAKVRARSPQAESVIHEDPAENTPKFSSERPNVHDWADTLAAKGKILACYGSYNTCVSQTGNCTGHGQCRDKYAIGAKSGKDRCFACHCFSTLNRPEGEGSGISTTQWGGNVCQKKDVSVPFWLITGFTITIIGAVSFAVGLLFSVGEEKLPGVIGAGVSRSK